MKYEELKAYLKQNPYCFRTTKEREEELNLKIMKREGKKISFVEASNKNYPDYE
jgi:hypothetical protein